MKAESKVVDRLRRIAESKRSGKSPYPIEWVVFYTIPREGEARTQYHQVGRGNGNIISALFDLSLKGWCITHVMTDGQLMSKDLVLKMHENPKMDTNIGPDTLNALAHVLDPMMKGEF